MDDNGRIWYDFMTTQVQIGKSLLEQQKQLRKIAITSAILQIVFTALICGLIIYLYGVE